MKLLSNRLTMMSPILRDEVEQANIPGAVVAVGLGTETLYLEAFGYAEHCNGITRGMKTDTLFDLASLTKVVATLPAILMLVDDGQIRLNDSVAQFIPEFADAPKSSVTVRHLLTHSAGLAADRPYYKICSSPEEIRTALRLENLGVAPGTRVLYSDIGFMLLGEIVELVSGMTLDEFCQQRIYSKLNMSETMFCPPTALFPRIAATEHGKVGVVHDEKAEARGGVSGHAGLFSTMADLIRYVSMWLGDTRLLSDAVRAAAVRNHTPALDGNRGLGWVCRSDRFDHTGDLWPETTVGHTGFTGTSVTLDPVSRLWMIILSNDVHYGREKRAIIRLRGRLHNLVGSAMVLA